MTTHVILLNGKPFSILVQFAPNLAPVRLVHHETANSAERVARRYLKGREYEVKEFLLRVV